MLWLKHPAYKPLRNRIISRFRNEVYTFKRLRPVIFLCGGAKSTRRDWIATYIRKFHKDKLVFYADDVWAQIAKMQSGKSKRNRTANALEMEGQLAQLADVVIIVVESPGTFAELGAFSLSEDLRKKILPLIDIQYKDSESFINTGPIRWVDIESNFGPTIFVDFRTILEAGVDIDERLSRLPQAGREKEIVTNIASSPRHLLFLLCDLLAIIGPAPYAHCKYYMEKIVNKKTLAWNVENLLSLGVSLEIIKRFINRSGETMFYRPLEDGELDPFLYRHIFSLKAERARFLSILQKIYTPEQLMILLRTA